MTPEEKFIQEYLYFDLDSGAGAYEKLLLDSTSVNWTEVKNHIVSMRYFYFLRTSYWQIISAEVKRRSNWRCSCGGRENLQVHHTEKGDNHHGEEHLSLDDLKCLCGKCHAAVHGKSVKDAEKKRQRENRKELILTQLPYYPGRIDEANLTGSSFTLTRKMLEELEGERKIVIERHFYEGWKIHRC